MTEESIQTFKELRKKAKLRKGVYIFWGEDNEPLYVGRSHNIYQRLCRHISGWRCENSATVISDNLEEVQDISIYYDTYPNPKREEKRLIEILSPKYNKDLQ